MIELVIAAFLITMALPSFSEFLRNSDIRSTTKSIVTTCAWRVPKPPTETRAWLRMLPGIGAHSLI